MNRTIGAYFKQLGILHAALCGGVAICIFAFKFMNPDLKPGPNAEIFLVIGLTIAALCLVLSRVMLFRTATPAREQSSLAHKLAQFRTGFIMQMALLEGASIINAIFWFIGGHTFNLGAALGLMFLMIFRRPARNLVQQLVFSEKEDSRVVYQDEAEY